jgi:phage terminase large subunit-like protein
LSYLAKHQQRPRSREGYRFKRAWFKHRWVWDADREHMLLNGPRGSYRFHAMKDPLARFITADGAASAKTSADHTAIGSWILTPRYDLVWIGCRLVQAEIPEQPAILKEEYDRHKVWAAYIEAVFSNVALYQYAARSNMTVGAVNPHGKDKLTRATPALILAEAGQLWLPDDEEAETSGFPIDYVLEELCAFKGDPKLDLRDDVVDVLSYAVAVREDRGGDSGGSTAPGAVPQPKAGQWRQYGPKQGPQPKIMGGAR